jgi:hypothetical protein
MPVENRRYSISSSDVDGNYIAALMGPKQSRNAKPHIMTTGDQNIAVVLRIYVPPPWDQLQISQLSLPVINRVTNEN